jgi:NAD(P)-dependent dehydrogenase (short-subunit alcohol dehydrogenase family)
MLSTDKSSNFAGIIGPLGDSADIALADWKRVLEVHAVGVWLCTKHQIKQMRKQDSLEV